MVLQGFGMGGQQGALDGGMSGDLSRVEMAEYEPHVARPAWRATKEGTFDFRLRFVSLIVFRVERPQVTPATTC